jgi:hypothetical protein
MKKIVLAVLALSIVILFACNKNNDPKSQYPFVYLHDCFNKTFSNDRIRLCLDEIILDIRCPEDVNCVWGGYAEAKFTFTKDNSDHVLILKTNQDTVVDGYRIKFDDLLPHPLAHPGPNPSETRKAQMEITRL